ITDMVESLRTVGTEGAVSLLMGYVRRGRIQDPQGKCGGERSEKKGDSDGVVTDRFGGNINWVGQVKAASRQKRCRSPQRTGGRAGQLRGGRGGWCPERGPNPGAVALARGGTCPRTTFASRHIPVTVHPSRQGVRLGAASTQVISTATPERLRDTAILLSRPICRSITPDQGERDGSVCHAFAATLSATTNPSQRVAKTWRPGTRTFRYRR